MSHKPTTQCHMLTCRAGIKMARACCAKLLGTYAWQLFGRTQLFLSILTTACSHYLQSEVIWDGFPEDAFPEWPKWNEFCFSIHKYMCFLLQLTDLLHFALKLCSDWVMFYIVAGQSWNQLVVLHLNLGSRMCPHWPGLVGGDKFPDSPVSEPKSLPSRAS